MQIFSRATLVSVFGMLLSAPVWADSTEQTAPREAAAEEHQQAAYSDAETLLWLTDHLDNIDKPVELRYEFARTGSYGDGFEDRVKLEVVQFNDDGTKSARMEFFTGPRKQPVHGPQVSNIRGNPVLAIFMQGDVLEMNRLTEGNWRYFQRQIKHALADSARIEMISFDFEGNEINGRKVTIAPYVDDERRVHFDKYADKTYEFIFSEQIPGMLYQIRTVIPDNINIGAEPLIEEVLTLSESSEIPPETVSKLLKNQ